MINLTGKDITFYNVNSVRPGGRGTYIAEPDAVPSLVLESTGFVKPYSTVEQESLGDIMIPVQRYCSVDNPMRFIRSQDEDRSFIVTNLYAGVARSLGMLDVQLYTVYGLVVDQDGKRLGCLGLEAK